MNNTAKLLIAIALAAGVGFIAMRMMKQQPAAQPATADAEDFSKIKIDLTPKNTAASTSQVLTIDSKSELAALLAKDDKPVIVKFSTSWCPPCKAIKPIFHHVATARQGRAYFAEVDTEAFKDTDYLAQFNVQSIPTIVIFKGGKEVGRVMGLRDRQALEQQFEQAGA